MTTAHRRLENATVRVLAAVMLLGVTALGVAACGADEAAAPPGASAGSTDVASPVDVETFAAAIADAGTTVVDVRTPAEYAAGHLAGAVNIDLQGPGFAEAVSRLDPSARYAVYCHSGNRSATAVSYLAGHGFAHVVELAGGIAAWEAAGRPVTTG